MVQLLEERQLKMASFSLIWFLCFAVSSAVSSSSWSGAWSDGSRRHSVWPHRRPYGPYDDVDRGDDDDRGYGGLGTTRRCPHNRRWCRGDGAHELSDPTLQRYRCHCLIKVGETMVFRRRDPRGLYSCSRRSLRRCSRYCDDLFEDANFRALVRQDACDVLNEEVNVAWYRRNEICGQEYYEDIPLAFNLCCSKGRPCS